MKTLIEIRQTGHGRNVFTAHAIAQVAHIAAGGEAVPATAYTVHGEEGRVELNDSDTWRAPIVIMYDPVEGYEHAEMSGEIAMHEARVTSPVMPLEDRHASVVWLMLNQIENEALPHTLVTDRASLLEYRALGYIFKEARPYWVVYEPDGMLHGFADRAACEAYL